MKLPSAEVLGLFYGLSEAALSVAKRSSTSAAATDRSSLRVLWVTILCSVGAAIVAARMYPQASAPLFVRLYPLGVLLFTVGLLLRWQSILYLGRFFTVDVAISADHRVVDSGPYRWLRHPSYAGALLAFLGFGICLGNGLSLLILMLPITWAFLRRIEVEEQALTAALGDGYRSYMRQTKRLVPFVY